MHILWLICYIYLAILSIKEVWQVFFMHLWLKFALWLKKTSELFCIDFLYNTATFVCMRLIWNILEFYFSFCSVVLWNSQEFKCVCSRCTCLLSDIGTAVADWTTTVIIHSLMQTATEITDGEKQLSFVCEYHDWREAERPWQLVPRKNQQIVMNFNFSKGAEHKEYAVLLFEILV